MSIGDLLAKTMKDIERDGWTTISVFAEDDTPPFAYSIGFQEHDHPEVIVIGLTPVIAHQIIGGLYDRVAAGETFADGQRDSRVLDGYDVMFREMPPDGRPLNMARRYYGVDDLPALQIVWPDREGRFPDEEGFDPQYAGIQDIDPIRV